MQKSAAGPVKGLSIAIIVLAVLTLIVSGIMFLASGMSVAVLGDPSVNSELSAYLEEDPSSAASLEEIGASGEDAVYLAGAFSLFGLAGGIFGMIGSILVLIFGIFGVRAAGNPQKAGSAFVMMIIGAIASFFFNIVIAILCIICAVFLNKLKKETM